MANKIEFTNLNAMEFVTRVSRYADSKVVYYSDEKIITFETYKKREFVESSGDKVAVIPPGMEFRPDLVSKEKYGLPDFWWKIMEVNSIKDIFEFKAGRTIVLPENIYG
jgi:hypothetical protein